MLVSDQQREAGFADQPGYEVCLFGMCAESWEELRRNSLPTRKSCFGESGRTCLKFWAAKVTRIWKMKWNRSCAWSRAHRGSPRRGCARWRTSHGENGPSSLSYMILFRQTSVCTMESRFIHSGFCNSKNTQCRFVLTAITVWTIAPGVFVQCAVRL